jgi:hypothetical protein
MSNTIQIKRSSTSGSAPTAGQLAQGELAVNLADEALYTKDASNAVVKLNAPSIDDKNTGATKHVTIASGGNVGIGTSSPGSALVVTRPLNNAVNLQLVQTGLEAWTVGMAANSSALAFTNSGTERARIDSSGNLLVGTTSSSAPGGAAHRIGKSVTNDAGNPVLEVFGGSQATSILCYGVSAFGANAANTAVKVGKDNTTSRSINAGGTVNASGADYAEYMTKAGDFVVAKGDVVGINAEGKLTNVFDNAVSFCVKSTDPSYVGGDVWGCGLEDDPDGLEAARQCVDRIAFAGQVPVNVTGATPGQFIIPVNDNGAIKGEAVSNPTFEQYQIAVGKVIAIEADGRARIIVKVA